MRISRLFMGMLYIGAGTAHFLLTRSYECIMPDYLPAHHELVLISGIAEIAGGLGVLFPPTRRAAALGLVVLLIAVMPANIWMAQHPARYANIPLWVIYARLPLQVVLIFWAMQYAKRDKTTRYS